MNTNLINGLLQLGLTTGLFAWLYFGAVSPAVHQWIATQKASKAKSVEEVLIQLADTVVKGLSVNLAATGADKKAEAIKRVQSGLADKGITVDAQRIADTVERAYQGFAQTDAPAIANAQSAYEERSQAAASQMAAPQSDASATNTGLNPTMGATEPTSTANPVESGAKTNGQPV